MIEGDGNRWPRASRPGTMAGCRRPSPSPSPPRPTPPPRARCAGTSPTSSAAGTAGRRPRPRSTTFWPTRSLLRLDTRDDLVEARALYARCGFAEVPAFNDAPYAHHWFAKPIR
ncbi:hypothetical protein ACFQZ4_41665 [Catellatospora coxensis]